MPYGYGSANKGSTNQGPAHLSHNAPAPTYQNVHQTGAITQTPGRPPSTVTTADGPTIKKPVTIGGEGIASRTHPFLKKTTTGGITGSNNWKKFIGPAKDFWKSLDPATFSRQVGSAFATQPRYIPWGLDTYTKGSKPGMAKIYAGTSKIPQTFSQTHGRISNLDDILKGLTGKIKLGQSEGVHTSTLKNIAKSYAAEEGLNLRGTPWAKKTGELLSGEIPTKFLNQTRNMFGQLQNIIPADLANKALLGMKNIDYSKIKNVAKPISKFMGRAMPITGGVVGAADAAYRAGKGDWLGSLLSGGSAVPGWGLIPLAAQVGTDYLGLTGPKTYKAQGGIVDLYRHGGF